MKTISMLCLSVLLLTSCASRAPKSYKQQCAEKGMILSGVSSETGMTGSTLFSGEAVNCQVPKSKVEECKVEGLVESVKPVDEYNSVSGFRTVVNGIGYVAFILPGIGLKYLYDSQKDEVVAESVKIQKASEKSCESVTVETAQN